ncbi:hypothetical protein [Neisseria iguanae]|uniref:Phage coat protein n=1 Tax=Neisseria iguanae TaxID=90242 RepID=A0A2P7TYL4_9NEIS|nr:hypothetical protein [Neisseria iguanae]PSJ79809.1 hypothetical protein C7N83_10040 [Neisseria iguanae]
MKNMNLVKKYGSKAAVAALVALPAIASADGIGDIAQTATAEINKIIPVVTAAGTALLSVYLLILGFRMVMGFFRGR